MKNKLSKAIRLCDAFNVWQSDEYVSEAVC